LATPRLYLLILAALATDCGFESGLLTGITGECDFPNNLNLNECVDVGGQHRILSFNFACDAPISIALPSKSSPIYAGASYGINHFIDVA